jgi:hypothetical protein
MYKKEGEALIRNGISILSAKLTTIIQENLKFHLHTSWFRQIRVKPADKKAEPELGPYRDHAR